LASASTSKEYKLAIKIAGAVSSSFDSAIGEAGQKIANLGSIAQAAAATAAAAWGALKLGEFISDAIEIGSEYETAFAKVQTIMDKTQTSSEEMSSAIKALSNETGIAAAELSGSVYDAISATGDTANAVSLVGDASKLATAGFAESGDALSVLTTIMNAYGLSADEARNISDSLIMTQNRGVTTVGALAGSMGNAIATASAYSVDLNNLEASYISLTKAGISTEESTTYLSSMLKELGSANTKVAKIIKSETGKSFGQMMSDGASLADVFDILVKSVNGDSEALINLWSSAEAGKAANAIASQGIDYFRESLDALKNSTGTTESAYETMASTFEFQSKLIKTNWDNLGISIFDSLSGPMARVLKIVNGAMPAVQGAISTAAANIGTMIANGLDYAIPKLTAFKDRAVELFGMASEGISKVVSAHSSTFDKLGELGSRIGDIFASIQEKAQPVLDYIFSTGIPNVADGLLDLVDRLADLGLFLTEHKELVIAAIAAYAGFKGITALSNLGNKISNVSSLLAEFQGVTSSSGIAAAIAEGKLSKLTAVFGALTGQVKLTDIATEAAKAKLGSFKDGFKAIGIVAKNAFTGLKGGISSIGTTLAGLGSKITGFIAANPAVLIIAAIAAVIAIVVTLYNKCEWFREKVDAIIEAVKGYLSAFWEKAKEVFQKVWGIVQEVWGQIQPYLAAAWQAIISAVSAVVTFFQTNILPGIKAVWSSICGVFAAAWELIKAVWEKVQPFFLAIWEAIKSIFEVVAPIIGGFFKIAWAVVQAVWSVAAAWFTLVWEGIKAVFSVVGAVLGGFFTTAWEIIKAVWNTVAAYFQAVFDTIAGIFSFVAAVLSGDFSAAWEAIKGIVGTWAAFFGTVWEGIKAVFGAVVSWFGGVFSAAWEAIKAVFAPVGAFFQSLWDTIVALFTSIGTAVGDAISGAVKGAINAVLKGAIGIINGFIDAINFAIGVINAIPGVSIEKIQKLEVPQLAKGGIVTAPTLLEAGEAGNEAIIPLGELWGNMQDMISTNLSGATDGIAALAEKFEAADIGGNTAPISDLLAKLDNLGNGDDDPDNGGGEPPVQIIYSPTNHYHFEGEAPSKEDIAGAESMSQDEFNRRVDQYFKDRQRKNFRG
jgi:TP901 family phage tail tape measure protein